MTVATAVDDGIGHVVLNDPPLNILTSGLLQEFRDGLEELASQDELRVLLLRANGKHFSAGASVEEHLPDRVGEMIPEFMETVRALQHFPLPVVAAVHGRCLGGAFELVMAADLIVAGESALLGVPEIQLGVFPPAACVQLPRCGARQLAAELIYTGDPQRAASLAEVGLIRRVVPDEDLLQEASALAQRIARGSAAALRVTKRALLAVSPATDDAMGRVSRIYLEELMATSDAVEGLTSFVEKRSPEWSHR